MSADYRTALLFGKHRHDDGQPIAMGHVGRGEGPNDVPGWRQP
jgi:hypothetical protein